LLRIVLQILQNDVRLMPYTPSECFFRKLAAWIQFFRKEDMVKLKLKSSQWIVDENNNMIIGEGRMKILEHVENTGSINQAAKMMNMSYKAVWSKIKYTEKHLNVKIVHSDRKTGSRLTGEGKNLLEKYRTLKKKCLMADDKIFKDIFTQT
jgi:molybdate transport system regulatory protein